MNQPWKEESQKLLLGTSPKLKEVMEEVIAGLESKSLELYTTERMYSF